MLEVRPLDARKCQIEKPYKFPYVELEKLVFLRLPKKRHLGEMKKSGEMDALRDEIMLAAQASGTTFVNAADVLGKIDSLLMEISGGSDENKTSLTDVQKKLSEMREEIFDGERPTDRTFIFLPNDVRFLEVKEKWETLPDGLMKKA